MGEDRNRGEMGKVWRKGKLTVTMYVFRRVAGTMPL